MNATKAVAAVADAFLPKRFRTGDSQARYRALLVLGFTGSAIIWGPLFAILHFFVLDRPLLGYLALFAVVHGLMVLGTLRWTGSLKLAGHLFSIVLILNLTVFACLNGGFSASALLWAPVVPMVGTLLAGRRAGLLWTLVFIAEIAILYLLEQRHGPFPSQLDGQGIKTTMLMSLIGVQILSFSLCFCYESLKNKASEDLAVEQQNLKQLLSAQEIERQLLAYDIHDGIIQMMTGAAMHLDAALAQQRPDDLSLKEMAVARTLLANSIEEARRLVGGLRPPILDECGLVAGIEYLIAEHPKLKVRFEHAADLTRLSPLIETSLFRICQESLANAAKYSAAELVEIRLFRKDDSVTLEVRDDGRGFATTADLEARATALVDAKNYLSSPYADAKGLGKAAPEDDLRFGLQGIRQRARFLGGRAEIKSQQGGGTTILVQVPMG